MTDKPSAGSPAAIAHALDRIESLHRRCECDDQPYWCLSPQHPVHGVAWPCDAALLGQAVRAVLDLTDRIAQAYARSPNRAQAAYEDRIARWVLAELADVLAPTAGDNQ